MKIFLKTVVELKSEAGESVVEDVQMIQSAEWALDNVEGRLSLGEEDHPSKLFFLLDPKDSRFLQLGPASFLSR